MKKIMFRLSYYTEAFGNVEESYSRLFFYIKRFISLRKQGYRVYVKKPYLG